MKYILLCLAFLIVAQVTYADDLAQPELVHLLVNAKYLLGSEVKILGGALDSEADIDIMMNNSGLAWRVEQQTFQKGIYSLLDHYREMAPDERNALNLLIKFDNLAINSFVDITRCNKLESKWAVGIEESILDHVAINLNAHAAPDWRPDLKTDPKVASGCK